METFLIIGIAQGLFLTIVLFSKKDNRYTNFLLAFWLLAVSFSLFMAYNYISGMINAYPHLIGLDNAIPFLHGPFLFLYAKRLTQKGRSILIQEWIHFLPFLLCFIYLFVVFYIKNASYKMAYLNQMQHGLLPIEIQIFNLCKFIQAAIYIYYTLILLKKHQFKIQEEFSTIDRINLHWLRTITWSLAAIYGIKFLSVFIVFFVETANINQIVAVTDLSVILFVFIIAYFGYKQPQIFANINTIKETKNEGILTTDEVISISPILSTTKTKYLQSSLTADKSKLFLEKLILLMQTEKPYLNPNITITEIADKLGISTKELSQTINEQVCKNFFNFINEYRIGEVKNRLIDKKYNHLSILGIAFDCGFNSKSTFNNVFKQFTGHTPTSYISATSKSSTY